MKTLVIEVLLQPVELPCPETVEELAEITGMSTADALKRAAESHYYGTTTNPNSPFGKARLEVYKRLGKTPNY